MSVPHVVIAVPDQKRALAYFVDRIDDSLLVERLGVEVLSSQCLNITIVTESEPPAGLDFAGGWRTTTGAVGRWLIREICGYLRDTPSALVLFDDFNPPPDDAYLKAHDHPAFWTYRRKLFWPITPMLANGEAIISAPAWAAAWREIIAFTTAPVDAPSALADAELSDQAFGQMASSITRLVTDVYDGEGLMVWRRG